MISDASVVVRSPHPLVAEIDGETVMFDSERGAYFALGRTGSRIWDLITEPIEVSDVCRALGQEFDVEPGACRVEAIAFLDELRRAGLVEVQP